MLTFPWSLRFFVLSCLPLSLMAALLCLASSAFATGSYTVTYSGGQNAVTQSGVTVKYGYTPQSGGMTYGDYRYASAYPDSHNIATTFSIVSSGANSNQLTATFTWNGGTTNDPAPTAGSVIVKENCEVSATSNASGNGSTTSSCSNGLGASNAVYANSARYSVYGGSSFTVTCMPALSLSCKSGTGNGSWASGTGSVTYVAAANPVTISLTGGIGTSTSKSLLVGQQLTATLSAGGLTQVSWNWTASGGSPFKYYYASSDHATYTPLGTEVGSQLVCYFAKYGPANVSCAAHLAVPAGTSPYSGLDVTATQPLTVDKPNADAQVSIGTVTDLPTAVNPSAVQLQSVYFPAANNNAKGITLRGTITTLPNYVFSNNYGNWNWTQLVTPGRQRKNNGVYEYIARTSVTPAQIVYGVQCIDDTYPYDTLTYIANGNTTNTYDAPSEALEGGSAIRAKDVLNTFNDYLMYIPPGNGSVAVPLHEISWFWEFHATKDSIDYWNDSGQLAQWGDLGSFPAFPLWTFPLISTPTPLWKYMAPS